MFKSKRVLLLASLMTMLVVFTACQDAEEEVVEDPVVQQEVEETPELEEEVLLSDWDGVWNNMAAYLDDEELEVALEDWYPTFISPNSTYDQIYEEITE